MGILKDVSDMIKDLKDEVGSSEAGDYLAKKRYSSIAKQSMEGTLQFPVLASRSLDVGTAQMVTKALEREFSSFVQIVLSMNPYLDLKKDKDIAGYLRNFHQNTGSVRTTVNDLTLENCNVLSNEEETMEALFITCKGGVGKTVTDNRNQLGSVFEHLRMDTVNSLHIPKDPLVSFKNGDLSAHYNNGIRPLMEKTTLTNRRNHANGGYTERKEETPSLYDRNRDRISDRFKKHAQDLNQNKFDYQQTRDRISDLKDGNKFNYQVKQDKAKMDQSNRQHDDKMNLEREKFAAMNRGVKLSDNDVKKSNELVPTLLNVSLNVKEDGNFGGVVNFVLGIKAVLHPINNDEMVNNLVAGCKNSNTFFNFIRWTSGETTFFKDFLLNINEIKEDVYSRSTGASHWWTTLKRRKAWAKMKHKFPIGKRVLPNSSIVVSMEEIEYIKSTYGFDLMDRKIVDKIYIRL